MSDTLLGQFNDLLINDIGPLSLDDVEMNQKLMADGITRYFKIENYDET